MHSGTWRKESRENFAPVLGYMAKEGQDQAGKAADNAFWAYYYFWIVGHFKENAS